MKTYTFNTPKEENTCKKCKCNECFNQPQIETHISIVPNKDPNKSPWVIHKTTITDIKSLAYYEATLKRNTE